MKGTWVVDIFLLHLPPTGVSVCPRHQLKVCSLLPGEALCPLLGWSSLLNSVEAQTAEGITSFNLVASTGLRQACFLIIGLPFFQLICKILVKLVC